MIQTEQLITQQIDQTRKYQHKQLHQNVRKNETVLAYQELSKIYIRGEQIKCGEQMLAEEERDRLEMDKVLLGQSLSQFKRKLRDKEIQKEQILASCQQHQSRMGKQQVVSKELKERSAQLQMERALLNRKIQQNEIIVEQCRMKSQKLGRRCEEEVELIEESKINGKYACLVSKLEGVISNNIDRIKQLQERNREKVKQLTDKPEHPEDSRLKLMELQTTLRLQNDSNNYVRRCIQAEQYVITANALKCEVLQKIKISREHILQTANKQTEAMEKQVQQMSVYNNLLRQKYHKFKKLQQQLRTAQLALQEQIQSYRSEDKRCLKKMTADSNRFEKKLDNRYLLTERRNIVDQYKKYLLRE